MCPIGSNIDVATSQSAHFYQLVKFIIGPKGLVIAPFRFLRTLLPIGQVYYRSEMTSYCTISYFTSPLAKIKFGRGVVYQNPVDCEATPGTLSYLACDTRDLVFLYQNTPRDHYPAA